MHARIVAPVYDHEFNLAYELRKCRECSCSRCVLNGTNNCYIEIAIRELTRYDQAFDSIKNNKEELNDY